MTDCGPSNTWSLDASDEWTAHDPFGRVKPADALDKAASLVDNSGAVALRAPRNGYASFWLRVTGRGGYRIKASVRGGLSADIFRAWYHRMQAVEGQAAAYWPDALIPAKHGDRHQLPHPDNRIEGQTAQAFWIDIFVPGDAKPGTVSGRIILEADGKAWTLPLTVHVSERVVPDTPCVQMDHNSYGARWLPSVYPNAFSGLRPGRRYWKKSIDYLHHYYRLVHEHRGTFHNLGYGHSGAVDPIYAPAVKGAGRSRHLDDWDLYDRHYGPLLDGSAFRKSAPGMPLARRPAVPVWGVYTPVNPDWPASYLWWGEAGYDVEFTRGLAQFDNHLRSRGWTHTRMEFLLNHKKRYRWYEWDGDEPKYAKDHAYHLKMGQLLRKAVGDTPVTWAYRMDASWQMVHEFEALAGTVDFWVCGGFVSWYPEEVGRVAARGDTVWWYGSTPKIGRPSGEILQNVYKTWVRGLGGYCAWLTVNPGRDPWYDCDGAETGSLYPGERFGIAGPIPSARLKIQRNGIQDIDLINQAATAAGDVDEVRRRLADRLKITLWKKPPRAALELPPEDWDSRNLSEGIEPGTQKPEELDPMWWLPLRNAATNGEVI